MGVSLVPLSLVCLGLGNSDVRLLLLAVAPAFVMFLSFTEPSGAAPRIFHEG
jgi:hypothetical protein